jgi:hypothetical protein
MLISWFQRWASRLIPGKTFLLVVVSGALGAGLAVGVPVLRTWLGGDGSRPAPPPVLDARFIPLGKTYLPELGRLYAAAWNEGAKALETGQPAAASLKSVGQSWDTGRVQLFDRLVTPEFSKIVAENKAESEVKPADLMALARAWRGFAAGLNPSAK